MITSANKSIISTPFRIFLFLAIFLIAVPVMAQKNRQPDNKPAWQGYHELTIGVTADQVREKLGKPKTEDTEGLFYTISETETVQFLLDSNGKVRAISAIFSAENPAPPTFADVFGKFMPADAREDGSVYKMVRYEDLGYWISYNRMAGEKAMVIVLMQKF